MPNAQIPTHSVGIFVFLGMSRCTSRKTWGGVFSSNVRH